MQDVATVVNMVRIRISDLLFCILQGMTVEEVRHRHSETHFTIALVEALC